MPLLCLKRDLGSEESASYGEIMESRRWKVNQHLEGHHGSRVLPLYLTILRTSDAGMEEATVDTLIERQRWDLQKFGSLFNPRIGAEILKVKLGLIPRLDAWIYTGEKTGFLV